MADQEQTIRRSARKRLELAEEMRAEIVQAAFAEFAERGYHQTAVADIARRMGVSPGTFYNYFKNKRDILDHVVDALLERILATLGSDNAPDTPTTIDEYRQQAMRIAQAVDQILTADRRIARMLLFESTSIDPQLTDRVLGLFDLAGQLGTAYLENGVRRGFFRPDLSCAHTADAITGMVLATAIRSLRSELSAAERLQLQEAVVRLLLDGARAG